MYRKSTVLPKRISSLSLLPPMLLPTCLRLVRSAVGTQAKKGLRLETPSRALFHAYQSIPQSTFSRHNKDSQAKMGNLICPRRYVGNVLVGFSPRCGNIECRVFPRLQIFTRHLIVFTPHYGCDGYTPFPPKEKNEEEKTASSARKKRSM